MGPKNHRLYDQSSRIAEITMGRKAAEEDPLAWWCLTELIVSAAMNYGTVKQSQRQIEEAQPMIRLPANYADEPR